MVSEESSPKVMVLGATGCIGKAVVAGLNRSGYSVIIGSRDPERARLAFPEVNLFIEFNYKKNTGLSESMDGVYAVVNLTGANIFQRWTGGYKEEIVASRVESTKMIVDAMRGCKTKPSVLVNGSAAGIYGYERVTDEPMTEESKPGNDFWGDLVSKWEAEAMKAQDLGIRVVTIRTSVVLSSDCGALPQLVGIFNKGIGGPIRPGTQWFPWIHIDDEVSIIVNAVRDSSYSGPINASAPDVPRMKEFAHTLGKVLGKSSRFPIPVFIIRLALGESAGVLGKGTKVIPDKALKLGFEFKYPYLGPALENLLKK
ncbi:TIGR01777 family oxidoreductase [Oxyplasma meridianum]|uniref:TIGR01777 family oxidoreductase n=1 Tax=Oxyplasma meridianum TaxID=3073602 RepID=A0AAX4NFW9_9ARCH